jgi:hypothetical protein
MVISQHPQFATQDDACKGEGIAPISQWYEATAHLQHLPSPHLDNLDLDPEIRDTLLRLRILFSEPQTVNLSTTDLHDLTCFALHKLLAWSPPSQLHHTSQQYYISESVLCATALYMLLVHGPTYFSHAMLQYNLAVRLKTALEHSLARLSISHPSLVIWLLSVGMVASEEMLESLWFTTQAGQTSTCFLPVWENILGNLKDILWSQTPLLEYTFRQKWEDVWAGISTTPT